MRRVRKSVAQRYYQPLSGDASTGSFLHDRMTGPQRLETDECWWCNCGRWWSFGEHEGGSSGVGRDGGG